MRHRWRCTDPVELVTVHTRPSAPIADGSQNGAEMARIRRVVIENFRSIRHLAWDPSPGINCLIGPGDSGKSTVLDAIDLCLGARRSIQVDDSDFAALDTNSPIRIDVTVGELSESLKDLDTYGFFLRGWDAASARLDDEPGSGLETVMTVRLTVADDLEPDWKLVSERAEEQGVARGLGWADRASLAPARIGIVADYHLGWSRGSVLNRLSDEKPEVRAALAAAGRGARETFGTSAEAQLAATLAVVADVAQDLGIEVGDAVKALLDVRAISFAGGVISLHGEDGVPLRRLGVGSSRLLVAGLQRKASQTSTVIVDEVEFGLEPHRVIRLLRSLGSKEYSPPLQVFMSTHSPVAIEELRCDQIHVIRRGATVHSVIQATCSDEVQGALRKTPSAFLAGAVVASEGASEVGLLRGIDLYRTSTGNPAAAAQGAAFADLGGGTPDRMLISAIAFLELGFRTALVRDDDRTPDQVLEKAFAENGGFVVRCEPGRALEQEIFLSLAPDDVEKLLDLAAELHGEDEIDQQIKSATANGFSLATVRRACGDGSLDEPTRQILGSLAKSKGSPWFKTVGRMERVGNEVVGPGLATASEDFRTKIESVFSWIASSADG